VSPHSTFRNSTAPPGLCTSTKADHLAASLTYSRSNMPPVRNPRKTGGQSSGPYKRTSGSFIPANETLDGKVNEEYRNRAESYPYTHYILKTGKYNTKTLKQVPVKSDSGYLRWMLTNPKACKDSNDDHVDKKGLVHWQSSVEGTVTANPPATGAESRLKE
jgi:hypothetical protein